MKYCKRLNDLIEFRAKVMQSQEKRIITVLTGICQTGQTRLGGGVTLKAPITPVNPFAAMRSEKRSDRYITNNIAY